MFVVILCVMNFVLKVGIVVKFGVVLEQFGDIDQIFIDKIGMVLLLQLVFVVLLNVEVFGVVCVFVVVSVYFLVCVLDDGFVVVVIDVKEVVGQGIEGFNGVWLGSVVFVGMLNDIIVLFFYCV